MTEYYKVKKEAMEEYGYTVSFSHKAIEVGHPKKWFVRADKGKDFIEVGDEDIDMAAFKVYSNIVKRHIEKQKPQGAKAS